jgi:hypothetical protein
MSAASFSGTTTSGSAAVGANNEQIAINQPSIEFAEPIGTNFHFGAPIPTKQWDSDIANETTTAAAGERDALSGKAASL